jgi:hypothetical protein
MKTNKYIFLAASILLTASSIMVSCQTDKAPEPPAAVPVPPPPVSFTEEFARVGDLQSKGWIFRNLSAPLGQNVGDKAV